MEARKGSKRIKNKNIKLLNGKPLIEYSIRHAHLSKGIENVIVSSDSEKILDISGKLGAIPIKRPNNQIKSIKHDQIIKRSNNQNDQEAINSLIREAVSGFN